MPAASIQDRISKGMGVTARKCGTLYAAYRASGNAQPLAEQNRYLRLPAFFSAQGESTRSPGFDTPVWQGHFDSSYTRQGDYLSGSIGTFFIASQISALDLKCILTNRQVSVVRKLPAAQGAYSGLFASQGQAILIDWPCSILAANNRAAGAALHETKFGDWVILLPSLPCAVQTADIVTDEKGTSYVVGSAEESFLGWRIMARQTGA